METSVRAARGGHSAHISRHSVSCSKQICSLLFQSQNALRSCCWFCARCLYTESIRSFHESHSTCWVGLTPTGSSQTCCLDFLEKQNLPVGDGRGGGGFEFDSSWISPISFIVVTWALNVLQKVLSEFSAYLLSQLLSPAKMIKCPWPLRVLNSHFSWLTGCHHSPPDYKAMARTMLRTCHKIISGH